MFHLCLSTRLHRKIETGINKFGVLLGHLDVAVTFSPEGQKSRYGTVY